MLIETLDALARLDYPNFEVLVIDNNTQDEAVWRPVEAHCARLGARFRFFHVDPLAGFKAGALNFALRQTAPDARDRRRHRQRLLRSSPTGCAIWCRASPSRKSPSCRRRRTTATAARAPSRRCATRSTAASSDRHDHAQRAQRDHPARHDDAGPAQALDQAGGWARVVHHRGRRARPALVRARLRSAVRAAQLRPRADAGHIHRLTRSSASAGRTARCRSCRRMRAPCSRMATQRLTRASAITSSPAGCRGSPTVSTCCSRSPRLIWSFAMIFAPHRIDPPLIMFSALPLSLFTFKLVKLAHLYARAGGREHPPDARRGARRPGACRTPSASR